MKKRITALMLAAIMVFALCACTENREDKSTAIDDPLTKDDVITMTTLSSGSWPYNEDWIVWDYIEEGTGATLEVHAVPDVDYKTKWSLMYASPDSYPFSARGFTALDSAGSNWKEYWVAEAYYDYNVGKWCYGAAEDVALDMYTWYNKMLKEKLCTPDFLTINTQSWQEMMTKFILGQEPLSGFDTYVETLREMGMDRLLAAYESAYNRIK